MKGEKRVSFVPNNKTPVLARHSSGILKHKSGARKSASNESQKNGHGEEGQDLGKAFCRSSLFKFIRRNLNDEQLEIVSSK